LPTSDTFGSRLHRRSYLLSNSCAAPVVTSQLLLLRVGRLQTDADRERVLEGLCSATDGGGRDGDGASLAEPRVSILDGTSY
jgi:hypothetical protein